MVFIYKFAYMLKESQEILLCSIFRGTVLHVLSLNISKIVGSKLLPNPRPIVIATAKVLLSVQAHESVPQLSE